MVTNWLAHEAPVRLTLLYPCFVSCIRGMRVTVGTVVGLVAAGRTREEILREYPYLEGEDIAEALSYAAWRGESRSRPGQP